MDGGRRSICCWPCTYLVERKLGDTLKRDDVVEGGIRFVDVIPEPFQWMVGRLRRLVPLRQQLADGCGLVR